jgi:hypothetical protein
VRAEHDARAALDQVADRRQHRDDAGVVADLAILGQRDVEVDADEHPPALDRQLLDVDDAMGERHDAYSRSPTNFARSNRRCE